MSNDESWVKSKKFKELFKELENRKIELRVKDDQFNELKNKLDMVENTVCELSKKCFPSKDE